MRKSLVSVFIGICLCSLLAGITSCDSNDCFQSALSYGYYGFYNGNRKLIKLSDTLTVATSLGHATQYTYQNDSNTIISLTPIDSLLQEGYTVSTATILRKDTLINKQYGAQYMELPLCYTQEEDTFYLTYSKRLADTIRIKHKNTPYFVSMDCGTVMHFTLLDIQHTHHLIDSIKIVDPKITNSLRENVKLFFNVIN